MQIKRIRAYGKRTLEDINILMAQWSKTGHIDQGYFKKIIKESYLFGLYDKNIIIGMVTLIPIYKVSGFKGSIEHLIVNEAYRGQGLGKKLLDYAIGFGKKEGMKDIFLTCEPHRKAANALYKKTGFKTQETIFYRKKI